MSIKRYSIKIATIVTALALCIGCEVGFDMNNPGIPSPDIPTEDNGDSQNPKRPIPLKPKKNPGGKIERPKLIDELINKVTLPK